MKKIADALFQTESDDGITYLADRDSRTALKRVRNYWLDDDPPALSGVSETDIALMPIKELEKQISECWGDEFNSRAERFSRMNLDRLPNGGVTNHRRGGSLRPSIAVAACVCVVAIALVYLLGGINSKSTRVVEIPEQEGQSEVVSADPVALGDDARQTESFASLDPSLVRSNLLANPAARVFENENTTPNASFSASGAAIDDLYQSEDVNVLSSYVTEYRSGMKLELDFKGERFQVISLILGDEFDTPYQGLAALRLDGNVRSAFTERLRSDDGIDDRRLQIGDRFLLVLQGSGDASNEAIANLTYMPVKFTRVASAQGVVCGTGSLQFSERGLVRAVMERSNFNGSAVTNCGTDLELALSSVMRASN